MSTALVLKNAPEAISFDVLSTLDIELDPTQVAARNELIAQADELECVKGAKSNEVAVHLIRKLRALIDESEESKATLKRPVDALGSKLVSKTNEFTEPLRTRQKTLQGKVNYFAQEQLRQQAEADRKAKEDAAKLLREQQELTQKAAQANKPEEVIKIQQQQAAVQQRMSAPMAFTAPPKVAGTKKRTDYLYDLVDVKELVKARPDLCRIEPDAAAIKNAIKGGMKTCPGLTNIREAVSVIA